MCPAHNFLLTSPTLFIRNISPQILLFLLSEVMVGVINDKDMIPIITTMTTTHPDHWHMVTTGHHSHGSHKCKQKQQVKGEEALVAVDHVRSADVADLLIQGLVLWRLMRRESWDLRTSRLPLTWWSLCLSSWQWFTLLTNWHDQLQRLCFEGNRTDWQF